MGFNGISLIVGDDHRFEGEFETSRKILLVFFKKQQYDIYFWGQSLDG